MEQLATFRGPGGVIYANLNIPYAGAPCVIMSHGLESNKDGDKWLVLAPRLHDAGFAYLRFSYRGCGDGGEKSQGSFEETTLSGRIEDYRAAIDFVVTTAVDKNRLGVVGSSFGGTVAIAARDNRIKAMVAMATPCKFKAPTEEQVRTYTAQGFFELPSGRRFKVEFWHDFLRYDICASAGTIGCPIMIIHGSADPSVPLEDAHILYDNAREPKRLEIIEEANHSFNESTHLEQVINMTLDWFKQYL